MIAPAEADRVAEERADGVRPRPRRTGRRRKAARRRQHDCRHVKRSVPNPVYDQLKVKLIDADTAGDLAAAPARRRGASIATAGEDPARAARPDCRIPEHGPRLHRAAARTMRNCWAGCSRRISPRRRIPRPTRSSCRSSIRRRCRVCRSRRTGCCWSPACCSAGCWPGLGMTVLFGQLDRSFSTVDELRNLGLPVLGGISVLGPRAVAAAADDGGPVRRRGRGARRGLWRSHGSHPSVGGADLVTAMLIAFNHCRAVLRWRIRLRKGLKMPVAGPLWNGLERADWSC